MSAVVDYLAWSVGAVVCASVSARMLVVAERRCAHTQAWLAASAFGLWSALAAVCFLWGEA
jgi:hypothetical protein